MSRMEEEAGLSVAELAGKFKSSDPVNNTQERPVRRRPPRSLQLSTKQHGDQEPPAVTSPPPASKTKRNSALIEKLQASLALSPSPQSPSPKSPGFRLLPLSFFPSPSPPPSPGSAPVITDSTSSMSPLPTSPAEASPITEKEGPVSFEAPPTLMEGSILSSVSKSRARHSLRRRPPSRRHRKSSSDADDITVDVSNKTTAKVPQVYPHQQQAHEEAESQPQGVEPGNETQPQGAEPGNETQPQGAEPGHRAQPQGTDRQGAEPVNGTIDQDKVQQQTHREDVSKGRTTNNNNEGDESEGSEVILVKL